MAGLAATLADPASAQAQSSGTPTISPSGNMTGSSDNSAIQSALNSLGPTGGTVVLEAGTFYTNAAISLPSACVLTGQGRMATVLQVVNTASVVSAIRFSQVKDAVLSDLRVQGSTSQPGAAVTMTQSQDCLVDSCSFDPNFQIVIRGGDSASPCVNCGVTRCVVEGSQTEGIEFVDSTTCYVAQRHLYNCSNNGIVLYSHTVGYNIENRIQACLIESCNTGIGLYPNFGGVTEGNTIRNCTGAGAGGETASNSTGGAILGNVITGSTTATTSGDAGIYLQSAAAGWTITGNAVSKTAAGDGGNGQAIFIGSDGCIISANAYNFNYAEGIWTYGSSNTIVGNVCLANSQGGPGSAAGIQVSHSGNTVIGNICDDFQAAPTQGVMLLIDSSAIGTAALGNKGRSGVGTGLWIQDLGGGTVRVRNDGDPQGPQNGSDSQADTPAVPKSGTPQPNRFRVPVTAYVSGGAVTAIDVSGSITGSSAVTTGLTSGPVRVPVGGSITIYYSQAPSWSWVAD